MKTTNVSDWDRRTLGSTTRVHDEVMKRLSRVSSSKVAIYTRVTRRAAGTTPVDLGAAAVGRTLLPDPRANPVVVAPLHIHQTVLQVLATAAEKHDLHVMVHEEFLRGKSFVSPTIHSSVVALRST